MKIFFSSWAANALALYLVARLLPGINIENLIPKDGGIITTQGLITVLVGSLILGAINCSFGAILRLLSLPLSCLTLGLFSFVVTGIVFSLSCMVTPGMSVKSFWWAILGGVLFGVLNSVISGFLGVNKNKE